MGTKTVRLPAHIVERAIREAGRRTQVTGQRTTVGHVVAEWSERGSADACKQPTHAPATERAA